MNVPIRGGVLLGALTVAWMFVMGYTGWYKDPALLNLFFLVVLFEIGIVVWALRKTAAQSSWGGQIVNGLVLSLVASAIIFCGSYLFTTVAFPNYFSDLQTIQAQMLKAQGLPDTEVKAAVDAASVMQTPVMNALSGVIGTVVTGVIVAAIAGAIWRKK